MGLERIYREESLLCLCRGLPEKAALPKTSVAFSSRFEKHQSSDFPPILPAGESCAMPVPCLAP